MKQHSARTPATKKRLTLSLGHGAPRPAECLPHTRRPVPRERLTSANVGKNGQASARSGSPHSQEVQPDAQPDSPCFLVNSKKSCPKTNTRLPT